MMLQSMRIVRKNTPCRVADLQGANKALSRQISIFGPGRNHGVMHVFHYITWTTGLSRDKCFPAEDNLSSCPKAGDIHPRGLLLALSLKGDNRDDYYH